MAIRSVLGKLPKICEYERLMIGTYEGIKRNKALTALCPFRVHENHVPVPVKDQIKTQGLIYHMELGGLGPARFAVEEFNKQKKSQLQFVRVVKFLRVDRSCRMNLQRWDLNSCHCLYALILEAIDAAGVVKFYQACVRLHDLTEGLWLEEFLVFSDNGDERMRLYHHLDNFYAGLHDEHIIPGKGEVAA
ncbi:hypothetical protein RchiOBHm_Chr6g0253151 [Rosa chinensis]|uniref:Uncharacterized protein n=1 Tax=Rosa chinensis TaxID=74649 RepID=A0A2P6PLA1_ROSCH|nr:uncharacterized protein LOC112173168 [Rosa chinensis]XP_024166511.1 uncharacterized protein LOC112173168 [Rosa chinensis]XP_024166512.1 uncharacterized protein LOC112173168 [Rosa chinensis]PRQ22699.1 hypothetical protein RchiOBHm_Chr6g0253151 [Rosa chinensis]